MPGLGLQHTQAEVLVRHDGEPLVLDAAQQPSTGSAGS